MRSRLSMYLYVFILCLFRVAFMNAQGNLAIGQWQQILPFKTSQYVTGGNGSVYYSTGTAIAIVHDDMSIEYLSKVEGLSGVNIRAIHYNKIEDALVIGYSDGNIDLVYEDGIINKNEILLNPNIQASRSIKSMYTDADGIVFMSTDFGVVIMDIENDKFETIFTPSPVNQVAEFEGSLYVALNSGIYRIPRSELINFIDFNLWEYYGSDFGLPGDYTSKAIAAFNGNLYADIDGDLYQINNSITEIFNDISSNDLNFLYAGANQLYAGFRCIDVNGVECLGRTIGLSATGDITEATGFCSVRPRYIYEDDDGLIWFADDFNILKRTDNLAFACRSETLNTPKVSSVSDVKVIDGVIYIAAGGADQNFSPNGSRIGTMVFKDGEWIEYGSFTEQVLEDDDSRDHYEIAVKPSSNLVYFATARSGILQFDPENFEFLTYGEDNSPLRRALGDNGPRPRVFGIGFDSNDNLWSTNFTAPSPLNVLKEDGTWVSFKPTSEDAYTFLAIDQADNKWVVTEDQSVSFIIFNEGDINDRSDDRVRKVNTANSELGNATVRSIVSDRDGAIWVGTDQGAVVFNCGDPFDAGCTGSRPKVLKDGFLALLLDDEVVNTIAVDPANRKWFGTDNGIFVQSPSGDEELFHFNIENSPLLTNRVIEIDIDPITGIVYIGTEKGLIAYRSDAIEGTDQHSSAVRTYPNPVNPGYTGSIAIVGLANESSVKIANVNGQLVYETEALGGQAIWDGRDFSGRRVSSGVYYVFGASSSFFGDAKGAITKILFLH